MSTNVSNITENIGGFPYILNYIGIYLPYALISFIAVIVGISGNVLITSAVLIDKELRKNPTCILITNLAIVDLVISLFVNTATVTGVLVGKAFFDQHMPLCIFFGASCLIACSTSLITMGILAFNRYVCILHYQKYSKIFSIRNTLIYCVFAWILGIIIDVPNYITGAGAYVYDTKTLSCLFDRLKIPFTISLSVFCIILPCLFICLLYMRIFCYAYKTRAKVGKSKSTNGQSSYRNTLEAVKIAKSLFASFFIFAACWIPVAIILIVGKEDQLPMSAHAFTNLPAHLNSAINPILYGIYNPKIRQGYRNLFRLITCNRVFAEKNQQSSTIQQAYRVEINN